MKIINKKLYLEFSELVECGISENTIKDAKKRGSTSWDFLNDPADGRKVLIGFEALNQERRRKVEVRFGNPYDRVARLPILNMVVNDWKANEYFMGYRYQLGSSQSAVSSLPVDVVNKYTRAAGWLNMITAALGNKAGIKKDLGLQISDFFMHAGELIGVEKERGKIKGYAGVDVLPGNFPGSYKKLMVKVADYKTGGYDSLISPMYGNKNAAKIGYSSFADDHEEASTEGGSTSLTMTKQGELPKNSLNGLVLVPKSTNKRGAFDQELRDKQMAVIRAIGAKANNFDAAQVTEMVNSIFSAYGWKTLSRARIHDIISENKHLLTAGRQGKRKYMSTIAMQVKRKAPDFPLYYWTLDGWTVEMMYQERGAKGVEYKRLVMVVVLDAFNKYPVGYAIGERENIDLIREACRNAIVHMGEMLGAPYRPLQVQSDNYQIKNLTPFYQVMAALYFTPAAVGNSKAKVIEPYLRHLNKKHAQKTKFWTGFNVDANKDNQVNKEYLDKIKTQAPDKSGLIKQITNIVERERASKIERFIAGFEAMPGEDKRAMGGVDWLEMFGSPLGKTNKITGQGIIKVIDGMEYTYDSFDPEFRANMHLNWQLIGEPLNLTKVLAVSPDGKKKFVLDQKRILPMDLHSTTQADVDYRTQISRFNKERMNEITDLYASDARVAAEVVANAPFSLNDPDEMALKLMLTYDGQQKEGLQDAKGLSGSTALTMTKIQRKEQKRVTAEIQDEQAAFEQKRLQFLKNRSSAVATVPNDF